MKKKLKMIEAIINEPVAVLVIFTLAPLLLVYKLVTLFKGRKAIQITYVPICKK